MEENTLVTSKITNAIQLSTLFPQCLLRVDLDLLVVLKKLEKAKNQALVIQLDCAAYRLLNSKYQLILDFYE